MSWTMVDPILTLDVPERTFVVEGGLPPIMALRMDASIVDGYTPTEVWRGLTIGSDPLPDAMLVVEEAWWVDRRLKLAGRIEGTI